jgi:hypothetical protein
MRTFGPIRFSGDLLHVQDLFRSTLDAIDWTDSQREASSTLQLMDTEIVYPYEDGRPPANVAQDNPKIWAYAPDRGQNKRQHR